MIRSTRKFVFRSNTCIYRSVKAVDYFADFVKFASTDDYNAFSGIRELVFPHFTNRPSHAMVANEDLRLVLQCQKLRKLNLTFHPMGFIEHPKHRAFVAQNIEETISRYNLTAIFECKALEEVYLTGIRPRRDRHIFSKGILGRLEELGVWMIKHYAAEGKDLKVFIHKRRRRWEPGHKWKKFEMPADGQEVFIPDPNKIVRPPPAWGGLQKWYDMAKTESWLA